MVPDSWPCKLDFAARAAGSTTFSKIDLRTGYDQILIHPNDIGNGETTQFGLVEFTRLPFGLRDTENTFQWMKDCVLYGLELHLRLQYLDNIIPAT